MHFYNKYFCREGKNNNEKNCKRKIKTNEKNSVSTNVNLLHKVNLKYK